MLLCNVNYFRQPEGPFLSSGEIETDRFISSLFNYAVASYALLIIFVVAMPVLFNNFLVGWWQVFLPMSLMLSATKTYMYQYSARVVSQ